jgi:hypothetical protein
MKNAKPSKPPTRAQMDAAASVLEALRDRESEAARVPKGGYLGEKLAKIRDENANLFGEAASLIRYELDMRRDWKPEGGRR